MVITAMGIAVPVPVKTGYDTCYIELTEKDYTIAYLTRMGHHGCFEATNWIDIPKGLARWEIIHAVTKRYDELKSKLKSVGIGLHRNCGELDATISCPQLSGPAS